MYAICDLESTGFCPMRNDILTLGCILADDDLNIVDQREFKTRPINWDYWGEDAEKIHGITREESRDYPVSGVACRDFINYVPDDSTFVCHANPRKSSVDLFDYMFIFHWCYVNECHFELYRRLPQDKIISTIERRREDARMKYEIKDQKLSTWMDRLNIDKSLHHSSLFDAYVCLEVLKFQKEVKWEQQELQQQQDQCQQRSQHSKLF